MKIIKREKSTSTKGHYVRNADLLPAVIEAKQLGRVTDKLIVMIQMIAERYSRRANFIGYSFREDMVSAAVENLCKNALKFNHEKYSNPFAFYTTAIHNSFLQYMADEKKHRNIRDALLIDAGSNPSFNFMESEKEEHHFENKDSDDLSYERPARVEEDETPIGKPPVAGKDALAPVEKKEPRYGSAAKKPSTVIRFGPEDLIIDPVTGAIDVKPEARARKEAEVAAALAAWEAEQRGETAAPVKKTRKPAVKKIVEEASPVKKSTARNKKVEPAAKSKEKVATRTKKSEAAVAVTEKKTTRKKKETAEVKTPAVKTPAKKTATKTAAKTATKKEPAKKVMKAATKKAK